MARAARPGTRAAAPVDGRLITIRAYDQDKNEPIETPVPRTSEPVVPHMARKWGYILRVRTRWAGDPDMRDVFAEKAVEDLAALGIGPHAIESLASVQHIEIAFHEPASAGLRRTFEAAAEIPWEYLLSAATQNAGRSDSLLVTRCLANGASATPPRPRKVLVVESAPGRIDSEYGFDDEEERLKAALNLREGKGLTFARTEPLDKLTQTLTDAWEAIHVTGVDTHQAAWLIDDFYDKVDPALKADVIDKEDHDRLRDGMILRGIRKSEQPVPYDRLAALLLPTRARPLARPPVVTLNLYYSGARTAREMVKRGAYAALGFLDEIDDEFAEHFFQAFYWGWCHDGKKVPAAFRDAWDKMDSDRMHGTGIIIWSGRSMIERPAAAAPRAATARTTRRGGRR